MDRLTRNKISQDTIVYRKVDMEYCKDIVGINTSDCIKKHRYSANGGRVLLEVPKNKQAAEDMVKQINGMVGKQLPDDAYTSVSMCENINYFTHRPAEFELQMPKGTKGFLTDNYAESEFIAKSGTGIEILGSKVYNDKGDWCIKIFGRLIQK